MTDTAVKYMNRHTEYYREYRAKKDGKPIYYESDMEECLLCHSSFVFLGSHVRQSHKMYMEEYKKMFGLDGKRGRTHGQFRQLKAKKVFENGTVGNLKLGKKYWFKRGDHSAGKYERSLETKKRLSEQGKRIAKLYGYGKGGGKHGME